MAVPNQKVIILPKYSIASLIQQQSIKLLLSISEQATYQKAAAKTEIRTTLVVNVDILLIAYTFYSQSHIKFINQD